MTESAAQHTYFRVEYTLAWNPGGQYQRSVKADPPVTLDEAVATHLRALNDYATSDRWIRLDEAQVVRASDVAGVRVVDVSAVMTPREAEVLRLLAAGRTNRQIGAELYISEKTASVHVSNILGKLGANGRTEAVAIAAQRGLLPTG